MMKKLLLLGLISCTAVMPGPECWLHPEKFMVKTGDPVNIQFFSGNNYEGAPWSGNITSFRLYYADVTDELADKDPLLPLAFYEEGTMMLTFTGNGDSTNAKTLVQVGKKLTGTYKKHTSLPLDIIPADNPYSLPDGKKLKVKILFLKKPLADAPVQLWHRHNDQTVKTELQTDEKGEVDFPVFTTGRWMVSTVKDRYLGSLTWGYVR